MFGNRSMFGYESDNPAFRRAYDMMVLSEIEKDEKELALRRLYGNPAQEPDEEVEEDG